MMGEMKGKRMVQFCCMCCFVVLSLADITPASNTTIANVQQTANESQPNNNTDSTNNPPLVFPIQNGTDRRIIENSKLTENFSPSEAEDMRTGGKYADMKNETEADAHDSAEALKNLSMVDESYPKMETEYIENGENTEDNRVMDVSEKDSKRSPGLPLLRGQLAAILAGFFVILAVIGYIGLLSWRRFLENRYGNREMLINEEELCTPTDMRNFSL